MMTIDEVLEEFGSVYEKCLKMAVSWEEGRQSQPTAEELLSMMHMVFSRKDAEFEKKMAVEELEKQKLDAVYGRGYSSDDYAEE
jgi:hypothetical protein